MVHKTEIRGLGSSRPRRASAELLQSCPTLCSSVDCSLPGSSVHGILQAGILEWAAIPFSKRSSLSPALADRFFTTGATWEAQERDEKMEWEAKWDARMGAASEELREGAVSRDRTSRQCGMPWGWGSLHQGPLGREGRVNGDRRLATILIKNLIQEEKRRKAGRLKFLF